ncbi:serine/threonine-protein kinase [Streptomyces sp. NPDC046821]|uniref:serine/threonine-protein kinase n=1 Tax=Streptomyces sp. NPDC046821 TaxID=3154702 RepID=UPI00340D93D0
MSEDPGSRDAGEERLIAGRYRLLSPLGEGGMGTVWRARDEVLGREVAVKEVRAPAGLPADEVERMYARLEREAWAAARIAHRNVVTVYDVATQDGRPWVVMELVRGLSLSDLLEGEGPLPPRRAARIGAEVVSALRAAHEAGVLHRDVKPGNVLIANDGRVVLTDFGIARVEGSSALTMTGEVIGSPEFLAPELALGRTPVPESDLWSLGVLLYTAVEGQSPFRQDTPLSTLRAVVDEELPAPRRAGALTTVIEGLLRKDPAERLPAADAERELRIVGAGGTPRAGTVAASAETGPTQVIPDAWPSGPTGPPGGSGPAHSPDTDTDAGRKTRWPVAVLLVGLLVLLLALGGLTYALLHRGGGGSGAHSSGSPSVTPSVSPSASRSPSEASSKPAGGGGQSASATPRQSVRVSVTAVRGSYSGTCPPPGGAAPAFKATFTVGRVPVDVEYRWVTESGTSSDAGWKTLSFASGDPLSRSVDHSETGYTDGATLHNRVSVEVRGPVRATSNSVAYTVTCEASPSASGTPTGGTTTPSPTPS